MFCINREVELDAALLQKMFNKYNVDVLPKLNRYKDYYDGKQDILKKQYNDTSKPCSRIVTNYCQDIADAYCGYLASPSYISYNSDNDISEIMDVLRYNDYQAEDSEFLLDALRYGVSYELMYIDEEAQIRFKLIQPTAGFPIFDDSLTNDLLYFVRFYKANEWDNSDLYNVDVYSDYSIKHYTMNGLNSFLEYVGEEQHFFSQCPANILMLADEKPVFECIMGLQDAANELLSDEIDDYSAFCDAYLEIVGADLESEDVATMKENRVLVLPPDSSAQWLTKNANDTQVENIMKRIHDNIYRIAKCPDFSSETFVGGVSSGIAIRYRLTGMETRAAAICARMKKALQRRIEIITGIATLKLGEEVFRDIEISFKRNIPEDYTSILNLVKALKGTISDATLLQQLPFVTDVPAELEAINAQKAANMELFSFGEDIE